jgi:hypothetical protein
MHIHRYAAGKHQGLPVLQQVGDAGGLPVFSPAVFEVAVVAQ